MYFVLFTPLFIFSNEWIRFLYLYGTSMYLVCENFRKQQTDYDKLFTLALATVASSTQFAILNVVCGYIAYTLVKESNQKITKHQWFDMGCKVLLSGSLLHVICAFFTQHHSMLSTIGNLFIFLSTGFWIATMLHWQNWNESFLAHITICMVWMALNWVVFTSQPLLFKQAISYNYPQALVLLPTWTLLLNY